MKQFSNIIRMQEERELMTVKEVCDFLRVSRSTLYRYARDGKIKSYNVNDRVRFKRVDVEAFVKESPYYPLKKA